PNWCLLPAIAMWSAMWASPARPALSMPGLADPRTRAEARTARLPRAAAAAGTYAARATAAAAAAARVAQRSPTARRPDAAAAPKLQRWRRENSALALATTSLGLEEILERELRSNGAVTAPLGSFWCFKAAPGQGLPHS
ncbi:unnamed protein product, partial [Effrenium voratum]